jgi:hypothetical protein
MQARRIRYELAGQSEDPQPRPANEAAGNHLIACFQQTHRLGRSKAGELYLPARGTDPPTPPQLSS